MEPKYICSKCLNAEEAVDKYNGVWRCAKCMFEDWADELEERTEWVQEQLRELRKGGQDG